MKRKILPLAIVFLLTGCGTLSQMTPTQRVEYMCYAAARVGVEDALILQPELKPQIEYVFTQIVSFESGPITGERLREILNMLPIKELKSQRAQLIISNTLLLYDLATAGVVIDIEKNAYVLAAATGIKRGMAQALGKTLP